MSKWKNVKTYMEVNPYTGQPKNEDAPANATGVNVAGTGDDSSVVVVKKKKKTLIDARTKSYKQHKAKLDKQREQREKRKSRLVQKVAENTSNFTLNEGSASSYITGELRDIVRNKSAKTIKFKDGSMKIDMTTANLMLQVLDKIKSATKKKIMDMLDGGKKSDFLKFHGLVMKVI